MYSDILKNYVPSYIAGSKVFSEIYESQGREFDILHDKIEDLKAQFNIDTATWALDIYETELGIATDYNKPLDHRRSVIKSKERGTGKLNSTMIKLVCDSFTNGNVEVSYDGIIHIKFVGIRGIPPNLDDLKNAMDQIKPAYKMLEYIFTYLLWSEFDSYNLSFNQWDALNLTWDEFETYKG